MLSYVRTKLNTLSSHVPPPPRDPDEPPRKLLLIHAHPVKDSFSSAIADAVEAGAKEGGHALMRRSLYSDKFSPTLTSSERRDYFELAAKRPRDVVSALNDLRWADSVVFVYPTWWFNMPAMLKGYFDRTLVPGPEGAWDFPSGGKELIASNGLVPKLTNVKRIAGISTYGAPWSIATLAGDNGRNCIATAIRPVFAPDCTCLWLGLYQLDNCSLKARSDFLDRVRVAIRDEF